jgi:hypothetical protein
MDDCGLESREREPKSESLYLTRIEMPKEYPYELLQMGLLRSGRGVANTARLSDQVSGQRLMTPSRPFDSVIPDLICWNAPGSDGRGLPRWSWREDEDTLLSAPFG